MARGPRELGWQGPDASGVLRLTGSLTAFTAPGKLLKPRAFAPGSVKAVDLSGLSHMDLNGAAWLFTLRRALAPPRSVGGKAASGPGAAESGKDPASSGPGAAGTVKGQASSGPGARGTGKGPPASGPGAAGTGKGPASSGPGAAGTGTSAAAAFPGPELRGLPAALMPVWELAEGSFLSAGELPQPRKSGRIERVGELMAGMATDLRDLCFFLGEALVCLASCIPRPWTARWGEVSYQAEKSVVNALPVTALVAFLVGLILAFQSAMQIQMFGMEIFVADLVGISLIRELGTLLTAIVLAGRSGSAFSSELASMKINQEIDAILTMGLSPAKDLAVPRILALTFTTPLLTVLADLAGLLGGNIVLMTLGYPFMAFWDELSRHLDMSDIATGLFKAFVFGFTVALIGCQRGLYAGESPGAVGEATTRGVVTNILAIAILDSLFAVLFYAKSW